MTVKADSNSALRTAHYIQRLILCSVMYVVDHTLPLGIHQRSILPCVLCVIDAMLALYVIDAVYFNSHTIGLDVGS